MDLKKLIERQDLDLLLSRLSRLEDQVPTAITESERPDFIVAFGSATVGIETTRTVHQECVRALKMQASVHPNQWVNLTHLVDGRPRRKNSELARSMSSTAILQPAKPVEEARRDWGRKVSVALTSKRQKLGQSGYQLFGENWLLIHDFPPLPVYSFDSAECRALCQHLNQILLQRSLGRDFDKIFIHSGDWLFRWSRGILELN